MFEFVGKVDAVTLLTRKLQRLQQIEVGLKNNHINEEIALNRGANLH